jgi:peptidyl-tRNA hydrolase
LRIGVDRPVNQHDVADYVLHPFKKEEKKLIENKMSEIEEFIQSFLHN